MNFQVDVLDRSQQVPVVVDFWAAWCGPCRILGPTIEQLAQEAAGQWELVKVDSEAYQDLARQYQIMSIPAVKMFYRGEVVADFVGALPRTQILAWLDEHLPSAAKEAIAEIKQLILSAQYSQAFTQLKELNQLNPLGEEGLILLAGLEAATDPIQAQERVMDIPRGSKYYEEAEATLAISEMMMISEEGQPKVNELVEQAREAYQNYDLEGTLKPLIEAIMIHKAYANEMPRRAVLGLFRLLGAEHSLTKRLRPHFNMALY
ncbi:MAG: tetratricopeptide repeat protein [Bacteroidota bacterium]